jgi:chitin disaccharide deacetylase
MSTTFIINADDFGFSRGITDGILRAHREGVLTSTTWMATMPDRDRALALALETRTLGVGIHLCLTQGEPLTKCRRITGRTDDFPRRLPKLLWRLRTRAAQREAQDEMVAQIEYARRRGLVPTHVDSHKHIHHLRSLHEAVIAAAGICGIRWIRTACETRVEGTPRTSWPYGILARRAEELRIKVRARGLRTTDWFFGLATTGRTNAQIWAALASGAPQGLGEVMVHPGDARDVTARDTRLLAERAVELAALLDPALRGALEQRGHRLAHFGTLAGAEDGRG